MPANIGIADVVAAIMLVVLLGMVPLDTQRTPAAVPAAGKDGGAFFALSVADLDREVAWYRDTLGCTIFSQSTAQAGAVRFALLRHEGGLIELLQRRDARPRAAIAPQTPGAHQIHGYFKAGFVVDDIDGAYERLKTAGVTFALEFSQPPNSSYRSFGVRDPEGNLLQWFGLRKASLERRDL